MSLVPGCIICDRRIDAYGRDGTRCARCNEPCEVCGKDVSLCHHPLAPVHRDIDPETKWPRVAA